MKPITIDLETIIAMRESWAAQAQAIALPVDRIRKRIAADPNATFSSAEVSAAMVAVASFYERIGRERALEELVKDLQAIGGNAEALPMTSPWRLPK